MRRRRNQNQQNNPPYPAQGYGYGAYPMLPNDLMDLAQITQNLNNLLNNTGYHTGNILLRQAILPPLANMLQGITRTYENVIATYPELQAAYGQFDRDIGLVDTQRQNADLWARAITDTPRNTLYGNEPMTQLPMQGDTGILERFRIEAGSYRGMNADYNGYFNNRLDINLSTDFGNSYSISVEEVPRTMGWRYNRFNQAEPFLRDGGLVVHGISDNMRRAPFFSYTRLLQGTGRGHTISEQVLNDIKFGGRVGKLDRGAQDTKYARPSVRWLRWGILAKYAVKDGRYIDAQADLEALREVSQSEPTLRYDSMPRYTPATPTTPFGVRTPVFGSRLRY